MVACVPERPHYIITTGEVATSEVLPTATQFTERPVYDPGTLVEYVVQSGDTLEHLAWRFGTTRREILFIIQIFPKISPLYRLAILCKCLSITNRFGGERVFKSSRRGFCKWTGRDWF